eukprot:5731741-Amphidinium_carterae.1
MEKQNLRNDRFNWKFHYLPCSFFPKEGLVVGSFIAHRQLADEDAEDAPATAPPVLLQKRDLS